jgi:hypothetical protein
MRRRAFGIHKITGFHSLRVSTQPRGLVSHLHVHITAGKFVQHLAKAFLFRFRSFGPVDPTQIVILLVGRTTLVCGQKAVFLQRVQNELGHGLDRSGKTRKIGVAHRSLDPLYTTDFLVLSRSKIETTATQTNVTITPLPGRNGPTRTSVRRPPHKFNHHGKVL